MTQQQQQQQQQHQSKKWSMIEAVSNVMVGFFVALLIQLAIFPFFDIDTSFVDNLTIALCFTVVSILRSYGMRRLFNLLHAKGYGTDKNLSGSNWYVSTPPK